MTRYVVVDRLPDDPLMEGRPLEILKPASMRDERFDVLWKFLRDSYGGILPVDKRFAFQVDLVHANVPSPGIPADAAVHQAATNAKNTAPVKKSSAPRGNHKKGKVDRLVRRPVSPDDLLDSAGIEQDADMALLEEALENRPLRATKQVARKPLRITSPEVAEEGTSSEVLEASVEVPAPGGAYAATLNYPGPTTDLEKEAARIDNPGPLNASPDALEALVTGSGQPQREPHTRPRPRGVLRTAKDTLSHATFPPSGDSVSDAWQKVKPITFY